MRELYIYYIYYVFYKLVCLFVCVPFRDAWTNPIPTLNTYSGLAHIIPPVARLYPGVYLNFPVRFFFSNSNI